MQAALQVLQGRAVVLVGGSAKLNGSCSLGFDALSPLLKEHRVLTFGANRHEIKHELQQSGVSISAACDTLQDAVTSARKIAVHSGLQTVVLSPGCASFDAFKDFADRGQKFALYATGCQL
jgi:UDP-N-acetylmuramoylalanine-D-glutamate ligase